ncbi:MAG: hypothetical protein EBR82_43155 [Caulobacteraceae bacterium]|nr:hypothetical protein [Caulobacteraceae bacterium]
MVDSFWGTTNIKVAAAASAFGAKLREMDPVTCIIKEDGHRQFTFWFNISGGEEAKLEMERTWAEMKSDEESAIRYVRAALENRETLLGLMKRAEPIISIQRGGQTLLVSERASPELKRAILKKL